MYSTSSVFSGKCIRPLGITSVDVFDHPGAFCQMYSTSWDNVCRCIRPPRCLLVHVYDVSPLDVSSPDVSPLKVSPGVMSPLDLAPLPWCHVTSGPRTSGWLASWTSHLQRTYVPTLDPRKVSPLPKPLLSCIPSWQAAWHQGSGTLQVG
jgi:hypothetical protein